MQRFSAMLHDSFESADLRVNGHSSVYFLTNFLFLCPQYQSALGTFNNNNNNNNNDKFFLPVSLRLFSSGLYVSRVVLNCGSYE